MISKIRTNANPALTVTQKQERKVFFKLKNRLTVMIIRCKQFYYVSVYIRCKSQTKINVNIRLKKLNNF